MITETQLSYYEHYARHGKAEPGDVLMLAEEVRRLQTRVAELESFLVDFCSNAEIAERETVQARYILQQSIQIATTLLTPVTPRSL